MYSEFHNLGSLKRTFLSALPPARFPELHCLDFTSIPEREMHPTHSVLNRLFFAELAWLLLAEASLTWFSAMEALHMCTSHRPIIMSLTQWCCWDEMVHVGMEWSMLGWNGAQLWVQQFPHRVKNHWRMAVDSRSFPTRSPWHQRGN